MSHAETFDSRKEIEKLLHLKIQNDSFLNLAIKKRDKELISKWIESGRLLFDKIEVEARSLESNLVEGTGK